MRATNPIDGCCVACGSEINERYLGFGVVEPLPCFCGWELGDEVLTCDGCGEVTDHLVDIADGSEYCRDCAMGEVLADEPEHTREVAVA